MSFLLLGIVSPSMLVSLMCSSLELPCEKSALVDHILWNTSDRRSNIGSNLKGIFPLAQDFSWLLKKRDFPAIECKELLFVHVLHFHTEFQLLYYQDFYWSFSLQSAGIESESLIALWRASQNVNPLLHAWPKCSMRVKRWSLLGALGCWPWSVREPEDHIRIWKHQKEKRTVHFATLMDIWHLRKCGVTTRLPRCIYRRRFVCISMDGRKCSGRHWKTKRLCRTSTRRSISLHSSKNERRYKITEKSKVRMSRNFGYVSHDTSGQNLGQTLDAGLLSERQFEEVPLGHGWKSAEWGMLACSQKTRIILICFRWWHQEGRIWVPCGRNWWEM